MKFEFVCRDCGKIQKPEEKTGSWEMFSPKCAECGGRLTLKPERKEANNDSIA